MAKPRAAWVCRSCLRSRGAKAGARSSVSQARFVDGTSSHAGAVHAAGGIRLPESRKLLLHFRHVRRPWRPNCSAFSACRFNREHLRFHDVVPSRHPPENALHSGIHGHPHAAAFVFWHGTIERPPKIASQSWHVGHPWRQNVAGIRAIFRSWRPGLAQRARVSRRDNPDRTAGRECAPVGCRP
jgi:hypothetical protein